MSRTASQFERPPNLPSDHYVSSLIYNDPEIFREEQEKIHRRTWKFACHESEIPEKGDYRTLEYCGTPLVVIRGTDGQIRTFVNTCSHRSARVARGPSGNARKLVCFFHLWTYDTKGNCTAMTRPVGYKECGPTKAEAGLREVRTETRLGMVFICLDDEAPALDAFVAGNLDCLEDVMGSEPLEVFHYVQVKMRANWKQWHETNMELYHEWGHVVNRVTGMGANEDYFARKWDLDDTGHAVMPPMAVDYGKYKGWSDRRDMNLPGLKPGEFRAVDLFPNTTVIVRATAIRIDTSTPIAPGLTLVEQRGLGLKSDTAEIRRQRQRDHNAYWGPFGRNIAEDVIFVEAVEECNRHNAAKYSVISRREENRAQDDVPMRKYYDVWARYMGRSASNPTNMTAGYAADAAE